MKESIAAMDPIGNPLAKGKAWSTDRTNPKKHREYGKAHPMVGVQILVIPYTKVTRGTWHETSFFKDMLAEMVPGSNIEKVATDPAFVSVENCEVAHGYGVTPYIEPKDNAVFRPHHANACEAHVFFATRYPDRWKSVYHWRVMAEGAIHSKKAILGDVIRGRLRSSRRNQEICRDIVHNIRLRIMDRYGGRPRFSQQVDGRAFIWDS